MRRASTYRGSRIQQSPANHEQVCECGHHLEAMPILIEPAVTDLLKAEDSFDDPEHVLHLGANLRLGAIGGFNLFINSSIPTLPSIREVPRSRSRCPDRGALPLITLVTRYAHLFAMKKMWHRQRVRYIRRRHQNRMNELRSAVYATWAFIPKYHCFPFGV
jgi:hypothetical protein